MMEHKRSCVSVDQDSLTSFASKRHKANLSISSKESKEKLGEKIAALQQLVSPYGKTDTASVLLETMEYISFLHEQVKVHAAVYNLALNYAGIKDIQWVLSAPYLQNTPTAQMQELEQYSLRSKGLCLVPISYTIGVDSSNGADMWAPIKTSSPKFQRAALHESLVQSIVEHQKSFGGGPAGRYGGGAYDSPLL